MNKAMIRMFSGAHAKTNNILTHPEKARNGATIVRLTYNNYINDYIRNFRSIYKDNYYHPGYFILFRIHTELLLLEPRELQLLEYSSNKPYRDKIQSKQLTEDIIGALSLLNATPFLFYAVARYLPYLKCLLCNRYTPIPMGLRPVPIHQRIIDNYMGPSLFKKTFFNLGFPCWHRPKSRYNVSCPEFYVSKRVDLNLILNALKIAQSVGRFDVANVLGELLADVRNARVRAK